MDISCNGRNLQSWNTADSCFCTSSDHGKSGIKYAHSCSETNGCTMSVWFMYVFYRRQKYKTRLHINALTYTHTPPTHPTGPPLPTHHSSANSAPICIEQINVDIFYELPPGIRATNISITSRSIANLLMCVGPSIIWATILAALRAASNYHHCLIFRLSKIKSINNKIGET